MIWSGEQEARGLTNFDHLHIAQVSASCMRYAGFVGL